MSCIEISEDEDDSFEPQQFESLNKLPKKEAIEISSDEETEKYISSDDDLDLPPVNLAARKSAIIKQLFPASSSSAINNKYDTYVPSTYTKPNKAVPVSFPPDPPKPKPPGFEKMIGGIKINLPVNPYPCQVALMFKVITAISKGQNCLLESPTGSGKTLALLCGALAWQQHERSRIAQNQAQQHFSNHPELNSIKGVADYIGSPKKPIESPEVFFGKPVFGERSIYDKPLQNDCTDDASCSKRQEPQPDYSDDSPINGQVTIHKKRRLNDSDYGDNSKTASPELPSTPEKVWNAEQPETPQNVRNLYSLVKSLQLRTSMFVGCSPIIYYGARTHKQIQQVVKEFGRTWYCGEAQMSVLSSRDYSCIREFDKQMWGTKNDMCRGCIKKISHRDQTPKKNETNCLYYDNRQALDQRRLPPAFDLEDLVKAGEEIKACPYYAAREMAKSAQIVFCPYNYLIEPSIRNSMGIDLQDNIVVIDEAHNIENICRDAATFNITRDNILASIKELSTCAEYRYANQDVLNYIDHLLRTLNLWNDWFGNQIPLVSNKPVKFNEAVHVWEVEHFIQTLNNHNIGEQHYSEFSASAEIFCKRLREDPSTLYGVTQATGTLIESLDTVLGYLFRESGKYKDDFKPALIRTVYGNSDGLSEAKRWRSSQFNQWVDKETITLRLMCMNPAIIFHGLKTAKCIILASGTLTPLVSLHSELGTEFPLQVSPNHVIPSDRVWIGTLTTCPNGQPLECNSRGTDQPTVQDALGEAILWVTQVTPHGVLCFLPSYMLMNKLSKRWQETGLWRKLNDLKHVFMENRNVKDHNDIMDDYYKYVSTDKGALLIAVYRGKVSEGMDFKDHQARAVITIGVPYPNTFDISVKEKMKYNDKYAADRKLLSSREWLRVQAYRALNQAVGRCVRHRGDWGAVLLVDARFKNPYYTEHVSKWVRNFLGNNHHTFESLVNSPDSLESFMQNMTIRESEEV